MRLPWHFPVPESGASVKSRKTGSLGLASGLVVPRELAQSWVVLTLRDFEGSVQLFDDQIDAIIGHEHGRPSRLPPQHSALL